MFSGENTPTQLPPPPRDVQGGVGCAIWFLRLFILPHMCVGVFLISQLFLSILDAAFGTDVRATVTKAYTKPASKDGTIYYLNYQYSAGGRDYTNSESVGAATFAAVGHPEDVENRETTVRVRHFEVGPFHHHQLTQGHSAWRGAGEALVFALFWNGIVSVFVYLGWVAPIRRHLLVRHGFATEGTIVSRRERSGKGTTYYAKFRFRNPENGIEVEREMSLPGEAAYDTAQPGRPVTVLYSPRNPRRAVIYEFSGYTVRDVGAELRR
jgi:hypothetical protein